MWWLVNNPGEVETALGLLDTLAELSAAANDLPVRRSSADVIDRVKPTRAELDFDSAVDHLLETGDPASGASTGTTTEPSPRSVPRHAGPQRLNDSPAPQPNESSSSQSNGATSQQPPSDRTAERPTIHGTVPPAADNTASTTARNGTTKPSSEQPEGKYREQFYSE